MYSGITQGLFEVVRVVQKPGLTVYSVKLNDELISDVKIGASISIDGTCQTVCEIDNDVVTFHAIDETLQRTTLNNLQVGRKVSVEKSLRYGDTIGGHEIAGHVMGTAEIVDIKKSENNLSMLLSVSKDWLKYIFEKGFIAVDGSSLTVGAIDTHRDTVQLNLIPETIRATNFGHKKIGDHVNIELDFKIQAIVHTVERILNQIK